MDTSEALNDHRYGLTDMSVDGRRAKNGIGMNPGMLLTQRISKFFARQTRIEGTGEEAGVYAGSLDELAGDPATETPWQILFQAINVPGPEYIGLDILGLAVIGRADPDNSAQPDLDLAPFEAHAHGVSRRHAVLTPTDEGLCVIDLDSANGTWLNGKYLYPGRKYRLRSGDMIEFGSLKLMVRVIGSAARGLSIHSTTQTRIKPPQR